MRAHRFSVAAAALVLFACGGSSEESSQPEPAFEFGVVSVDPSAAPAPLLSNYQLLHAEADGTLRYNERVQRYSLNTQLFSDYALKDRVIYVPEGETVAYREDGVLDFPVGTAVVKTFSFPADLRSPQDEVRIIETRVMIHTADGWENYPYLWRADGSDADYAPIGAVEELSFVDGHGNEKTASYLVPQRNQCRSCHEIRDESGDPTITLIGPKARHLNGPLDGDDANDNQLEAWASAGLLSGLPSSARPRVEAFDDDDLEDLEGASFEELDPLARGYLDINCGHCHNPNAVEGVASQLFLNIENEDPSKLGVCKRPGSAGKGTGGLQFDIVPGDADASILVFRVETELVGAMMPQIGRSLQHEAGAALIRAWVTAMPAQNCE